MPAAAATAADTSTRLKRSASRSLSASSLRLRNIAKATTAAMCSPLTDSKCVRPLRRIASASSSLDRILVAGDEGDGDPRLSRRQPAADVPREPLPDRSSPPRGAGLDQLDRPQRLADRADAPEPRVAGEIVGPGQRHRRRRHQPGAQPDVAPAHQPLRRLVLVDRHPHPRRKRRVGRRQGQADRALGDHRLDPLDPRLELAAIAGASSRGAATHSARAHTSAQPSAAASANQPSARPLRSAPERRSPPRPAPPPRQMNAAQSDAAGRARTRRRCRSRSRPPATAEAARAPPRAAFQAARQALKSAPSNSSEHAVEEAHPLC